MAQYVMGGLVTFMVFFAIVVGLYAMSFVDQPSYRNVYEAGTGHTAETYTTFSQLVVHGEWVFAAFIAAWIALHATLYAVLAMSTTILFRNRAVGLSFPWICASLVTFAMALLGLEAYGPNMVTPFNLTQLPWQDAAVSLIGLVVVSVAVVTVVLVRAPRMDRFQ